MLHGRAQQMTVDPGYQVASSAAWEGHSDTATEKWGEKSPSWTKSHFFHQHKRLTEMKFNVCLSV